MNIDLSQMEISWIEDEHGNHYALDDTESLIGYDGYLALHHCSPCELYHVIHSYNYHPKNWFMKLLCKNKKFYKKMQKKERTFEQLITGTTTYRSPWAQECIVAMVNSGDYTLEQAIWVFGHSCERCMNVLLFKYIHKDGYEEYSEEWNKANTYCNFCEDMKEDHNDNA